MTDNQKNVNSTDISKMPVKMMPTDIMGLFFFAYRDFVSDADALLVKKEFGRAHHRVLYFVNIRPGMSVATLLSILKITKQSLARVLRQLIDNGYIEQKTDENDRRKRLLFATKKGIDFFKTLSLSQASRIKNAMQKLPDENRDIIVKFLEQMVNKNDHEMLVKLNLIKKH